MGVLVCISLRWVVLRYKYHGYSTANQVTASVSSVFMTGRVKDLEEFQYKVPLVFSYEGNMFLITKKKIGNMVQFSASILGSLLSRAGSSWSAFWSSRRKRCCSNGCDQFNMI